MDIEKKDLLIQMWETPNPYAFKFVLNQPLKNRGKADFYRQEDCAHLPLFYFLFGIQGVKKIFVFQNQMTVTHDGSLGEEELERQVKSVIETRMAIHKPDFNSFEEEPKEPKKQTDQARKPLSPLEIQVEGILDRHIRPGLRADGGDIELLSVQNNEVRISYQGACGGCPSAFMGTLSAIEGILQQEMGQENLTVIPV